MQHERIKLRGKLIHRRHHRLAPGAVLRVADDADDFKQPRHDTLRRARTEPLTNGIDVWIEATNKRLVHDNLARLGLRVISAREIASGHKAYPHGVEVILRHRVEVGIQKVRSRRRLADQRHGHSNSSAAHDTARGERDADDARYVVDATTQCSNECLFLRGRVAGKRRVGSKGHQVVAIEARVQIVQLLEGAYQETCSSEEERTERDLKDEDRLSPAPSATRARAMQRAFDVCARDAESECHAGKHGGQRPDAQRKRKDAPVGPEIDGKREASRSNIPKRRQQMHH